MTTTYPGAIDALTNPLSTDTLASPGDMLPSTPTPTMPSRPLRLRLA